MKYKMLVMDIDDTLLPRGSLSVSEENKEAIKKAEEKGIYVTLATGRGVNKADPVVKELNITKDVIYYNGALIENVKTKERIRHLVLPKEQICQIDQIVEGEDLFFGIYTERGILAKHAEEELKAYLIRAWKHIFPIENVERELKEEASRVLLIGDMEHMEAAREKIKEALDPKPYMVYFYGSRCFLEILPPGASKGKALAFLAKRHGFRREEIIAIGDNENDIEMIEYAGLGVAMENSQDTVKERADYITLEDKRNGVAEVIHRFLL